MSSPRTFDACQVERGNNQRVRGVRIICGKCGHSAKTHLNSFRRGGEGADAQEIKVATRKFTELGWYVGDRTKNDRCPECHHTAQQVAAASPPQVKQEPVMGSPPPVMSRDDRRIIFEKLNETYDKNAYISGWTDKRVAEDLGVARAWVAKMRDENFGPAGSNPEIDALLVDGKALVAEAKTAVKTLTERIDRVETKLCAIEKTIR